MQSILDSVNRYAASFIDAFKVHDTSPGEMVTAQQLKAQYRNPSSFTDRLPFIEYLPSEQMFLMDDCRSVAAGFEIKTINTEGFPLNSKAALRDQLMMTLRNAIPQHPTNPWIAEIFFSNTYSLSGTIQDICRYNLDKIEGLAEDPVKKLYSDMMAKHLDLIAGEKGIFVDTQVTGLPFGGKETQARMFVYRRRAKGRSSDDETAIEELKIVREKLFQSLKKLGKSGADVSNMDGRSYYDWMFRWFNPKPEITEGNTDKALKMFPYPGDEDVPVGRDFSGMLSLSSPESDADKGVWKFDGVRHKYLGVELMRSAPAIGALSAPKDGVTLFDSLPAGAIFAMKIVFLDKESVGKDIRMIEKRSVGDGALAKEAKEEAQYVEQMLLQGNLLFPVEMGFYIKAQSEEKLRSTKNQVISVASNADLQITDDKFDKYSCDSYLRMLPGNYRWDLNKTRGKTIKCSLQHIANYFPILGRGRGSGTPVQAQFNRGGEMMMFDCIKDRQANSHKVIIGGTGAGKSVKLVEEAMAYIAQYNPRVFIVEKGDSFKLLTEYLARQGKKTHSIKLDSKSNSVLPPFANAYKALAAEEVMEEAINNPRNVMDEVYEEMAEARDYASPMPEDLEAMLGSGSAEDDEEKDYLGEMELMARIIVTGGDAEANNKLTPADQSFIRRSILNAAKRCKEEGKKHPLVQDVAEEMKRLIETDKQMREKHREKAYDLGEAMMNFTVGLAGKLFNRYGDLWPEVDVTHIDMGDVVKAGKEAELAVAYASALNSISDIAERDQMKGRPIIVITDEGHNFVSKTSKASAILVPAIVKIVKMMRKLGCWYWIATQNIKDFSDEAGALLKLVEWWEVLLVPDGEDDEIARFKKLDDDQKAILSSVTKENRRYTEGFVMCANRKINNQLFRNVPPSIVLALAMSDPDEKKARWTIMQERGLSELDAALYMADELDKARGFSAAA
jgi:conjugative transfer ATPase